MSDAFPEHLQDQIADVRVEITAVKADHGARIAALEADFTDIRTDLKAGLLNVGRRHKEVADRLLRVETNQEAMLKQGARNEQRIDRGAAVMATSVVVMGLITLAAVSGQGHELGAIAIDALQRTVDAVFSTGAGTSQATP